jgi:hypothetical protein
MTSITRNTYKQNKTKKQPRLQRKKPKKKRKNIPKIKKKKINNLLLLNYYGKS